MGDPAVYAAAPKRLPDQVFDEFMELDLGGRIVQFHYFGMGCGPGDSIVYLPKEKIAWTGNLILGPSGIPWVIEGHAQEYLQTMARVIEELDIEVMIPRSRWCAGREEQDQDPYAQISNLPGRTDLGNGSVEAKRRRL